MDPEAQMTVEDWQDITACVFAASLITKTPSRRDQLQQLAQKCVARAKALQEGRVVP
jgi:hypothetical protein